MSALAARIFDVAIAGGGPAGAFLARELARGGLGVLLLEAHEGIRRKVCGEYLCPRGTELLRAGGLGAALEGKPIRGMRLFSPGGIAVETRFPGGAEGSAVRRDRLDEILLSHAAEAGAEVQRGSRLEKITFDRNHWELVSGEQVFHARLLVGADGRQSFVARALGVQRPSPSRRAALHFFSRTSRESGGLGEMHILEGGAYVGICPVGNSELNVSIVCDSEELRQGARAAVERLLARSPYLAGRFLPLPEGTQAQATYPLTHAVRAVAGPGWALVGDAAGFLDPLTGEGIYQALQSSALLAARALEGGPAVHRLYARDHELAFRAKTRVNRVFQRLIRHPLACDWVGSRLRASQARADAFIGLVGNVHGPAEAFKQILFS